MRHKEKIEAVYEAYRLKVAFVDFEICSTSMQRIYSTYAANETK